MISLFLAIAAIVCMTLEALGYSNARVKRFGWLGLALWGASMIVGPL